MNKIVIIILIGFLASSCNFLKNETEFDEHFMLDCSWHSFYFDVLNNANSGLASDNITAITTDHLGNLYVGSPGNGLSILRPGSTTFEIKTTGNGLSSNNISSLAVTFSGVLLIGTDLGLDISTDSGNTFIANPYSLTGISDINIDDFNRIFIADSALVRYSLDDGASINTLVGSTVATGVATSLDGRVYSSTTAGLQVHTSFGDGAPTTKTTAEGLINNTLSDVAVDYKGRVYTAHTGAGGVSISYNGGDSFVTRDAANGIDGSAVYQVKTDRCNTLYLSTDNALSVSFDGGNSFSNFYPPNAMVAIDEMHVTRDGRVIIGSSTSSLGIAVSRRY